MKKLLIIAALIAGTAIYLLSAAWALEHINLYLTPASESKQGVRLKGSRVAENYMGLYIILEGTLGREIFDKNMGTAYYYALEVEHSADMRL